jgi:hypothetical protein
MGLSRILSDVATDILWKEKAREPRAPALGGDAPLALLSFRVLEAARSPNALKLFFRYQALNVCGECIAHAQAQHKAGREEVW